MSDPRGILEIRIEDWPDYIVLPRIENGDGTIKHIICEGSRQHVVWWDTRGSHCTEHLCEINRRARRKR